MYNVPHYLQVDLSELRAAISIACRLGFASRLPNPRDSTGARRSGGAPQSHHIAYVISCYAWCDVLPAVIAFSAWGFSRVSRAHACSMSHSAHKRSNGRC